MHPKKFYTLILTLTLAAYGWVGLCFLSIGIDKSSGSVHPCFIKTVTGIPCPSCGTTRSVLLILEGKFYDALQLNPLGFVAVFILMTIPFLFLYDAVKQRKLLFRLFTLSEKVIGNRKSAALLILFFLILWGWNIHKGL